MQEQKQLFFFVLSLTRGCQRPISFTSSPRNAIDLGASIDFKVSSTYNSFTINPLHRLHLILRMLITHQTTLTMKHTTYTHKKKIITLPSSDHYITSYLISSVCLPVGKGANDLAQPCLITLRSSDITTDPSAAIPQYKLSAPSDPRAAKTEEV